MKKRVLICGGRKYYNKKSMFQLLDSIKHLITHDCVIIQGGANGADSLAKIWAHSQGLCCIQVDANWDYYNKKAGSIRNMDMIKYCNPDLVIAFPGGMGTKHMIKCARAHSIDIWEI